MRCADLYVALLPYILDLAVALPLTSRAADCYDSAAPYDESCWATLDLTQWLTHWKDTAPICTQADSGAHCCSPSSASNEPWSGCFLRLALANADYDCSVFNGNSCALAGFKLADHLKLNALDAARYRYVVRNVYAINNLFNTWYTSLNYAISQASLFIQPLINKIDPDRKTHLKLAHILTAVSGGLVLLGLPEVFAGLSIILASTTVAALVNSALQQAPLVAKVMWPIGTESTRLVQIGELDTKLLSLTEDLAEILNKGLRTVMSDLNSFLGFASSGAFSNNDAPSIPAQTAGMDLALKIYLITTAMNTNGLGGAIQPLASSSSWLESPPPDRSKSCSLDGNGVCGQSYWSSSLNQAFEITKMSDTASKVPDLMSWIEDNSGVPLPAIFDAGYTCNRDHGDLQRDGTASEEDGVAPSLINFDAQGKLDMSCMSQLRMTVTCGFPCPVKFRNDECPFMVVGGDPCAKPILPCGSDIPSWLGGTVAINQQCT